MGGGAVGAGGRAVVPQFLPNFCKISLFCLKFWHFYAYSPLTFQLTPALSNSLRRLCREPLTPLSEQKFRNGHIKMRCSSHQCCGELNFPGIRWLLITSRDKLTFYDSFCDFHQPPIEFRYFTLEFFTFLLVFFSFYLFSLVFCLCSLVFYLCSLVFHLCSTCVHLCSTCVLLVFTCVHLCSTCVRLCSFVSPLVWYLRLDRRKSFWQCLAQWTQVSNFPVRPSH